MSSIPRKLTSYLLAVLGLLLITVSCTAPKPAAPTATPGPPLVTPPASPAQPAELVRDATLYDGPTGDAHVLGTRGAGTQVSVAELTGERAKVYEKGNPALLSFVDVRNLAMSQASWDRLQLGTRRDSALALCLAAPANVPVAVAATILGAVRAYGETFLQPNSPHLTITVFGDQSAGAQSFNVSIGPTPPKPVLTPLPAKKPSVWDILERRRYDQIVRANQDAESDFDAKMAKAQSSAKPGLAQLASLRQPQRDAVSDCVDVAARLLGQGIAPSRQLAVLFDPSRDAPPSAVGSLPSVRLAFLEACSSSALPCGQGEANWRRAFAGTGAQPPVVALASASDIGEAFNSAVPVFS